MNDTAEPELVEELKDRTKTASHKTTSGFNSETKDTLKKPVISVDPLMDFKSSKVAAISNKDEAEIHYHEPNKVVLGPGIVLKTLREEAKLTQEDVAKELRLAVRHIAYLEQDQFEKFTALAFYIGYLRNYSRLLDADAEKMIAKFYAVYKVMPEVTTSKRTKSQVKVKLWYETWPVNLFYNNNRLASDKQHTKWFIGVAVILFVLAAWWLFSDHTTTSNQKMTLNTIDNKELEHLTPEVVDNLLPTSPVIVQAPQENTHVEAGNLVPNSPVVAQLPAEHAPEVMSKLFTNSIIAQAPKYNIFEDIT